VPNGIALRTTDETQIVDVKQEISTKQKTKATNDISPCCSCWLLPEAAKNTKKSSLSDVDIVFLSFFFHDRSRN
jgi:hypothetical protein